MRAIELNIAWRYLFSKKGHNAINTIATIATATVAVVTAAMVCVLSVMNGFGELVEGMFSQLDPELKIVEPAGKTFHADALSIDYPTAEVLCGQVLAEYGNKQVPCTLMGVDSLIETVCDIRQTMREGQFVLNDGAFDRAVLGQGLAARLGVHTHYSRAIHIYAPRRQGRIDLMRPDQAFHHAALHMAGSFGVNQSVYDDELLIVPIALARRLLEADSTQVTALHVKADPAVQAELQAQVGEGLRVQNRYEQQGDFYRILRIEKWLTAALLLFILIIACCNLVGALAMIHLDKQEDTRILHALGMDADGIRRTHTLVGVLITALGATVGIGIGLALCFVQEQYGLITLGDGTEYVIAAYPVAVRLTDLLVVAAGVNAIGLTASWIASWRNTTPTCD